MKVSLFLQDGFQKQDGTITLSYRGVTPPGIELPGKVVYFDPSGNTLGVDSFLFPAIEHMTQGRQAGDLAGLTTHLGSNLYAKEKGVPPPAATLDAASAAAAAAAASGTASMAPPAAARLDSAAAELAIRGTEQAQQSTKDLNVLADLIGPAQAPTEAFKLNLFPDTSLDIAGSGSGGGVPMITIDVGTKAMLSSNRDLMGIMGDMSQMQMGHGVPDDEDLLDLLDSAS